MAKTPLSSPAASLQQQGSFMGPASMHFSKGGKLHRRGNSASSSFHSPPLAEEPFPAFKTKSPRTSSDLWPDYAQLSYSHQSPLVNGVASAAVSTPNTVSNTSTGASNSSTNINTKPGTKIKPYLRKLSAGKDANGVDLSRPAAENSSLTGLGIDSFSAATDVTFTPVGRNRHNRSTSNNSQFSTNSSYQRPTATHVHPMRQTPRPYTPPVSKSYSTSVVDSEHSDEAGDMIMGPDEFSYRQHVFDPSRRSGSVSSTPQAPAPLHISSSSSLTRLASASQTSLPPFAARARGDTMRSMDTATSPSSRTSMDKAISFIRGDKEPIDPASRAASISAARQAFREKEEAKNRKLEKDELRQVERQLRKTAHKDERDRRKAAARSAASSSASAAASNEKLSHPSSHQAPSPVGGREYASLAPAQTQNLPRHVHTARSSSKPRRAGDADYDYDLSRSSRGAKTRWAGFIAWLKKRMLTLGRKLRITT